MYKTSITKICISDYPETNYSTTNYPLTNIPINDARFLYSQSVLHLYQNKEQPSGYLP